MRVRYPIEAGDVFQSKTLQTEKKIWNLRLFKQHFGPHGTSDHIQKPKKIILRLPISGDPLPGIPYVFPEDISERIKTSKDLTVQQQIR